MSDLTLPKDTEEVACFPDFSSHHMTLERAKDGTVYLASWRFGVVSVVAVIEPGGRVVANENY
jgi:hypothetical protein